MHVHKLLQALVSCNACKNIDKLFPPTLFNIISISAIFAYMLYMLYSIVLAENTAKLLVHSACDDPGMVKVNDIESW